MKEDKRTGKKWSSFVLKLKFWFLNKQEKINCVYSTEKTLPIKIIVDNARVKYLQPMNVLEDNFDSELNWSNHIAKQVNKANK